MTVRPGDSPASWRRLLLLPSAARYGARAPRDVQQGWDRFWSGVTSTGDGGDVLWDSSDPGEFDRHLQIVLRHLDPDLPVVDVGCGNGRQSRQLARHFPRVVGVDLSGDAVDRARRESAGQPDLDFQMMDLLADGAGERLAELVGEANVFVRGVFHVMPPAQQARLAGALRPVLGIGGRVFLSETNFEGDSLHYLRHLGARAGRIPFPLQRAIATIPKPRPFGPAELHACFPPGQWTVEAGGSTEISAIPMQQQERPERIPGYYAVLRPVRSRPSPAP